MNRTDKQIIADFYAKFPVIRNSGCSFDIGFRFPRKRKPRKVALVKSRNPDLSVWKSEMTDADRADFAKMLDRGIVTAGITVFLESNRMLQDFVRGRAPDAKPKITVEGYGDSPLCDGYRTGIEVKFDTEVEMARWFIENQVTFKLDASGCGIEYDRCYLDLQKSNIN